MKSVPAGEMSVGRRRARIALLAIGLLAAALVAWGCGSDSRSGSTSAGADAAGGASTGAQTTAATSDEGGSNCALEGSGENAGTRVGLVLDTGGLGDKSFNDAAYRGLKQAHDELGVTTKCLEPNVGGTNRQDLLALLASQGYNPVLGNGFAFQDAVTKAARQFPNTTFVNIAQNVDLRQPNAISLGFDSPQVMFLAGVAAALKSRTGKLGYIGGVQVPELEGYGGGFAAGACYASDKYTHKPVTVSSKYLTQPPDFTGFRAPDLARQASQGMIDNGIDVIFHAAGGSGIGLFQAAAAKPGTLAIGIDSDQYETVGPPLNRVIMTSTMARQDLAVFRLVQSFLDGDKTPGVRMFNLENDGLLLATSGGMIDDYARQLAQARADIIAGKVRIPATPQACS
jgi:basic membrane protein A and related proteins